jgi:anti-sigma regulatory factor (Ser/Thr protein kinase)
VVADPIESVEGIGGSSSSVLEFPARARQARDWRFPSTALSVRGMRRELRPFLTRSGLPDAEIDDLVLAASEAAANGVEHAHDPSEPFFDVRAEIDGRRVRIVVRDYGRWATGRHDHGDRGRGLGMMSKLAAVSLTASPLGTSVTLCNVVEGLRDS